MIPKPAKSLLLLPAALALALAPAASAIAQQASPAMLVQTTPSFTVVLEVGPVAGMVSPSMSSSSMTDPSAEVMVGMVGMPMAATTDTSMSIGGHDAGMSMGGHDAGMSMGGHDAGMSMGGHDSAMSDQGMPVNHQIEVHITDTSTGAVVNDVSPVIRIRDKSTGVSRDLNDVMAMYSAEMGPSDFHYGQNVWLPDGQYDITVMLGTQSALFRDVMVAGMPHMLSTGG